MSNRILPVGPEQEGFLRDESRRTGAAVTIAFPESEGDVIEILRATCGAVTIQGALTGVAGAAVPEGGAILNFSRMNRIGEVEGRTMTVEPGALLCDVRRVVAAEGLYFPPDPTETTASLGGMAACNASGPCSLFYGPTRNWIEALRVVLADGAVLSLRRGAAYATGRSFSLTDNAGRVIEGTLPSVVMPDVKSAAGYFVRDDMDLIDLFIGAEGTLGVITELELRLIELPPALAGLVVFLPSEAAALKLVRTMRSSDGPPVAIEFFNSDALNLLRSMRHEAFAGIPELKSHFHSAVYLEFHGKDPVFIEERSAFVFETMVVMGAGEDDCWFAEGGKEMEMLKTFRHAVPEAVNLLIDERRKKNPELTKLGTDMSVPDASLEAVMHLYNEGLRALKLESVIFGHIGSNHVHVNILPRTMAEYDAGKNLYLFWADQVVAMGGSVSAEHGIGKLKVDFLKRMIGESGVSGMIALKKRFDPQGRLNRGTLFDLPKEGPVA